MIGTTKVDILNHLKGYVDRNDAVGLANDSWLKARKIVSANKAGNSRFPWFDDNTIRAFSVAKRTPEELRDFLKAIEVANGVAAARREAVNFHKATHQHDDSCPCCGPFSTYSYVAYHKHSKTEIIRCRPGDPPPSLMKVARTWARMQSGKLNLRMPKVNYVTARSLN